MYPVMFPDVFVVPRLAQQSLLDGGSPLNISSHPAQTAQRPNPARLLAAQVQEGDLFVCVHGLRVDGHQFASAAVANGAGALVIEEAVASSPQAMADFGLDPEELARAGVALVAVPSPARALVHLARAFYGDPSREMTVVGITGTNGKTTTSWLVKAVLEAAGHTSGVVGTIQYAAGNRLLTPEGEVSLWWARGDEVLCNSGWDGEFAPSHVAGRICVRTVYARIIIHQLC